MLAGRGASMYFMHLAWVAHSAACRMCEYVSDPSESGTASSSERQPAYAAHLVLDIIRSFESFVTSYRLWHGFMCGTVSFAPLNHCVVFVIALFAASEC